MSPDYINNPLKNIFITSFQNSAHAHIPFIGLVVKAVVSPTNGTQH